MALPLISTTYSRACRPSVIMHAIGEDVVRCECDVFLRFFFKPNRELVYRYSPISSTS